MTGLHKVGHVTDLPTEKHRGLDINWTGGGTSVSISGVHFTYTGQRELITGLSLKTEPGARVALVGESGCGKSTLAALICRLQTPSHGSIQLNGIDVSDISLKDLRRHVALVSDANEIFDGSIEENITIGRDFVSYTDVIWALSVTGLSEDVEKLPEGIKTPLVSAGRNLSRGQMQRILIARAIVERPQLLILDEAFTGIDENKKLAIMKELFSEKHDWTIINISHDVQTVLACDSVSVLSSGKIIESGAPNQLIDDPYSHLSSLFSHHGQRIKYITNRGDNG